MKTPKEIAPLFPMQDRYHESLKHYQQQVAMLVSVCETLLAIDGSIAKEAAARKLRERIDAVNAAATGPAL